MSDETTAVDGIPTEPDPTSAKPKKEKKEKVKKPVFDLVDSTDEAVYPFSEEMPEGYVLGKFQSLKKRDFKEEYIYSLHKAACHEAIAVKLRDEAEKIKSLGGSKARSKAKRLIKLQQQFAALREQLEGQGVDVDSLLEDE